MRKVLPVVMMVAFMVSCKKENDNPNEVNSTDKNFLVQTYLAATEEIQAGKFAMNKTDNAVVQNFGQSIVADYTSVQTDLIAVASKLNFALTDTIAIGIQNVSGLNELNGYSFDTAYMHSRVRSQMNILSFFQNELNKGNNTYVKYYFLNKYIDKVRLYYLQADSISRAL